jgi:hypothetical protein
MKFLLITAALNNPFVYADLDTCKDAARALRTLDSNAVCIPAGEILLDPIFKVEVDPIKED